MMSLITGADGFIGQRLLQTGDRGLTRNPNTPPSFMLGELLDFSSLVPACEDVETVFHCGGFVHAFSSADPDLCWRINYEGTLNLLAAAGKAGVRRFIFLSSVKAMAQPGIICVDEDFPGEPLTNYGKSKRAAENAVLEAGAKYGMHVVNLRLAMVYGRGGAWELGANGACNAIRLVSATSRDGQSAFTCARSRCGGGYANCRQNARSQWPNLYNL